MLMDRVDRGAQRAESGAGPGEPARPATGVHLFLLGYDYHLGDLLWLTPVLAEYRRQARPAHLLVGCPDRPISRILEGNPSIDELLYGEPDELARSAHACFGSALVLHDLRPVALAEAMLRDWRHHWPWLYYRDLWLQARGQWLATFLHLGCLHEFRPTLVLSEEDRATARTLPPRVVAFAPHIGQYGLPLADRFWRRVKGWDDRNWRDLTALLRADGFTPVTLAGPGQASIPGTLPLIGLPIRQVAGIVESAEALVSAESGLWFVAAACGTPFAIVPWWLPRTVDWAAPMGVPHLLVRRPDASAGRVFAGIRVLASH
ncbi:MAG: hypothetical protein IT305_20215 [Chloroflexi bacterium]|nr:hypothetical protein [Chloroflexota bacterium]